MATALKPNPVVEFTLARGRQQAANEAAQAEVEIGIDTVNNASEDQIASVRDIAEADQTVAAEKNALMLQVSNNRNRAIVDYGGDPNAANSRLLMLRQRQDASYDTAMQMLGVIQDKQSATLFSDPLKYINGVVTLPTDIGIYNKFKAIHDASSQEFDDIVAKGTAVGREIGENAATTTAVAGMATQKAIAAAASGKAAELQAANAKFNMDGAQIIASLSMNQLNAAHLVVATQAQQMQMSLHAQQMKESIENQRFRREEMALRSEDRQFQQAIVDDQGAKVNNVLARLGLSNWNPRNIDAQLKRQDPITQRLLAIGEQLDRKKTSPDDIPTLEGIPMGANAADVANFYKAIGVNISKMPASSTVSFLADAYGKASIDQSDALSRAKDPAAKSQIIANGMVKIADDYIAVIDDKDSKNPYKAPAAKAIFTQRPDLLQIPFLAQEVQKLSDASPGSTPTDAAILSAAKVAVKANPKRFNEIADGLTKYYSTAALVNNFTKNYLVNGLPKQESYNASLPTGTFGGKQTTNLIDPNAVKRMLTGEFESWGDVFSGSTLSR